MRSHLLPIAMSVLCFACERVPEEEEPSWDIGAVYGVANMDDDNGDGTPDGESALVEEENDLSALVLDPQIWVWSNEGSVKLALSGEQIRVYGDGELLLEDGDSATIGANTLIEVEFLDTLVEGVLTLTVTDAEGERLKTVDIDAMSGPLLLNHHMQETELVVAMADGSPQGNTAFTDGFADVLGEYFRAVSVRTYQYDVWVQDEIEFATLTSPDHRVDVVIDSIRIGNGSGLDDFPENEFEAPDFARRSWGSGRANSQDSFGNFEVTPPLTVDGVEYPFGRIYWGEWFNSGPRDSDLLDFLNAQKAQAPFQLDVSFLCVGHVDEFTTFLPDTSAPKGYRLYVTDTTLAWELLEGLNPDMTLPRYSSDKGYDTVADILNDTALVNLNAEIQADYLEPAIETLKAELDLTDEDIVRMPMLFEETRGCGGTTAAFFPGTVNMQVTTLPGEDVTHVFMPDPFFRETEATATSAREEDPFIAAIEAILPPNVEPHWLDDWDWYHMMLGEVHCGSNTVRTPSDTPWWEDAMHLLGGDQ